MIFDCRLKGELCGSIGFYSTIINQQSAIPPLAWASCVVLDGVHVFVVFERFQVCDHFRRLA